jgi:hypothetical protein
MDGEVCTPDADAEKRRRISRGQVRGKKNLVDEPRQLGAAY